MFSSCSTPLSTSYHHSESLALSRHAAQRFAQLQAVREQGRRPRSSLALRLDGLRAAAWKPAGAKS